MLAFVKMSRPLDVHQMTTFFQTGSELVSREPGSRHEVLRDLATEDGLAWINKLLDHGQFSGYSATNKMAVRYFRERFTPLFDTLTHPDVLSSFVLESYRTTIFGFMYGPRGARGERLLSIIVENFRQMLEKRSCEKEAPGLNEMIMLAIFESSFAVAFHVIELSSGAQIHSGIQSLAEELGRLVKKAYDLHGQPHDCQSLAYLSRLQERLGVGLSFPVYTSPQRSDTSRPFFEIDRDPPGALSLSGTRHDNDKEDINEIKLFPTLEEIRSVRPEYLPTIDPSSWHQIGVKGLLDRHYRLLREDTIGQLRDAIRDELDRTSGASRQQNAQAHKRQLLRTFAYGGVTVNRIHVDDRNGVCLRLSFLQPRHLWKQAERKRKEWWTATKRLQPDALVCLIGDRDTLLFCCVCEEQEAKNTNGSRAEPGDDIQRKSLFANPDYATITIKLCTVEQHEIRTSLQLLNSKRLVSLVEFPGVLLPSFQHTLQALQTMSRTLDIPFRDFLVSRPADQAPHGGMPPPKYSMKTGFSYSLKPVVNQDTTLRLTPGLAFDQSHFTAHSSLDPAQCQAVTETLQRSLALIQGPPGTGKSYTGVSLVHILLQSRKDADLGPILCVCYTNHALDQMLEHLLASKVTQIIRVGSRSKSEQIKPLSLKEVARNIQPTRIEKNALWELKRSLRNGEQEINKLLEAYKPPHSWKLVRDLLETEYPEHYRSIFGLQDEDGFTKVTHDPKRRLPDWISEGYPSVPGIEISTIPLLKTKPIIMLTVRERQALCDDWERTSRNRIQREISRLILIHRGDREELRRIRSEVDLRCLQQAHVVGITTSGLARNMDLLRRVRCKVLICEEAGEILEAHMLTALLPSLQHLIMIGDHLQLRPQVQRYDLSSEHPQGEQYSLDVSLFERLANPREESRSTLLLSTLETQRRMHPSISRLVRNTLYPNLKDDPSVSAYPRVVGMKQRLLWFDHAEHEDGNESADAANTSHTNGFEVDVAVALASHLIRQGIYKPNDIAVLTPYLGQLHRLRKVLGRMYELMLTDHDLDALEQAGLDSLEENPNSRAPQVNKMTALQALRVATIDNFQGEEAKVVIISLVRSNAQNRCGFLRTSNRINVLLSRAQHGMYIIGNTQTAQSAPMWHDVIGMLKDDDLVKPDLELECPRHPNTTIRVRHPEAFQRLSPEGGCDLKCDDRLTCGHACINRCHSLALHSAVVCLVPCPRPRKNCSHSCPRKCGEPCPERCDVDVFDPDRVLPCGHAQAHLPCWQSVDLTKYACKKQVQRIVPGCQHRISLPCHVDHESDKFVCGVVCGDHLSCDHTCQRKCSDCKSRSAGQVSSVSHGTCQQICGRGYTTCRHQCVQVCHGTDPCPLCESPCEVACIHSRCSKKCHEPCAPCAEQHCASQCPHGKCSMPCAAPCDWIPCEKRCETALSCGHQCPTLCGEICPDPSLCQECASPEVKGQVVDFLEWKTYGEIDLGEEPCIFPACGHIMTLSSMDGHMGMAQHYTYRDDGSISSVNSASPFSVEDLKTCPSCRGSLRSMARYGRIVRRALLDESTKKFIIWSNRNMVRLSDEFYALEKTLMGAIDDVRAIPLVPVEIRLTTVQKLKHLRSAANDLCIWKRYGKLFSFRDRLQKFAREVSEQEQPFNRVSELCEDARRRRNAAGTFDMDDGVLQTKCYLSASALVIRCDLLIVSDLAYIVKHRMPSSMVTRLYLDLGEVRAPSAKLLESAAASQRHPSEVEAHLFTARCASLEQALAAAAADGEALQAEARTHLEAARRICETRPGSTRGMLEEVESVEASIRGSSYNVVTPEERMAVVRAMAGELLGTGHWYYCRNGHPFTVGECGGPMQETRCPECEAPVGGQHHRAADGVVRADDLEQALRNVTI